MSLVRALLGVERKKSVSGLVLPDDMSRTPMSYGGEMGSMLRLCECLDGGEFAEAAEATKEIGVDPATVWGHQCAAFDRVMRMI